MSFLAPFTTYDTLHPIVVHFPVALLSIVPLFLLLSLFRGKDGCFRVAAFILMVSGTAGVYLASSTGDAAKKVADRNEEINRVLHDHEELAERTQIASTALTLLYGIFLLFPKITRKKPGPKTTTLIGALFLVLFLCLAATTGMTAHKGGMLVHQLKVTASL